MPPGKGLVTESDAVLEVLAQARLRQATEAADARVKPWQAAVKVGDCFIADSGEEDLVVFGEVLEGYQEAHLRHYRSACRMMGGGGSAAPDLWGGPAPDLKWTAGAVARRIS